MWHNYWIQCAIYTSTKWCGATMHWQYSLACKWLKVPKLCFAPKQRLLILAFIIWNKKVKGIPNVCTMEKVGSFVLSIWCNLATLGMSKWSSKSTKIGSRSPSNVSWSAMLMTMAQTCTKYTIHKPKWCTWPIMLAGLTGHAWPSQHTQHFQNKQNK